MNHVRLLPLVAITLAACSLTTPLLTGEASADERFSSRIAQAMEVKARPAVERERDANRKPVETLAFFGIDEDMRVLELVPGGGWYTRLLAPALAKTGQLYVWIGIERLAGRLESGGIRGFEPIADDQRLQSTDRPGIFDASALDFGVEGLDAVLTFRNLHNLTADARAKLHHTVYEALAPGGVYGVVDHTRRHMQPDDPENRRRLDPVQAIQEITAAGFVLEAWSDLHYRPDDELRYEVGRRTVTGNTDRFTLRFRKPR